MTAVDLRPYQRAEYDELLTHDRFAVWSEAGLGKTRPLLLASAQSEGRKLVIAPASVRDTRVWEREAERIGVEAPEVVSYHQAARGVPHGLGVLILDEAHRNKERKVSWADPIYNAAWTAERVYESTGTPMPNAAYELWNQLRLLRPKDEYGMRYYWPWMRQWFDPAPTRHDAYAYSSVLSGCHCEEDGVQSQTCEHWHRFHEALIAGYAIRHLRDEVLTDLPPLDGHEDPLLTPMTTQQRRAYASLAKDFLAAIPSEGVTIEALSDSGLFTMLHQLSSGLSVLDPAADPKHQQSGKLAYLREHLRYVDRPVLVVCWYKNSARAVAAVCDELRIDWSPLGSNTSARARAETVVAFGEGKVPVLIASLPVIKEGVDGLQYGSDEAVMFERSWVPGDNEQTIRRLHRLGQVRPVTVRQLVTPKTVDFGQWETIAQKGSAIGRVLRPVELRQLVTLAA